MKTSLAWACAALLFAATPGRAAEACDATQQQPQRTGSQAHPAKPSSEKPRKYWWIDHADRAELSITDQQSAEIEKIWQKSLAKRAEIGERLDKLNAVLDKMILNAADEAAVKAQLDLVESVRMSRLLTQDQRLKLDAKVKAMRERDRGRRGGPGLQ
jgi:Spy/CpxP family protein refolding chaperone